MKHIILHAIAFVVAMVYSQAAFAQAACPPGTIAYGTGTDVSVCGPDNRQQQPQQIQPDLQLPPPQWVSRWGAIATDFPHSAAGAAVDESNEQDARDAAIANCRSNGGVACKVELTYSNGCAALAIGKDGHNAKAGVNTGDATRKAMRVCNAQDKNCFIYYTGCSFPAMVN